jgi:cytidylate kinase
MAIITISRGSFSHGKEIAEKVAETLGYECISREILLEASQYFKVSEKKLLKSIHDAPTILERVTHGRERYIAYIRAALLDHVARDNIVYHGHAGHLLIPEVHHVLKVRIIAEMSERISLVKKQQNVPEAEATAFIAYEDKQRTLWTRDLFKVDIEDPRLYDMILNIGGLRIEDACNVICATARSETFATTPESRRTLRDLAVTNHVKAVLEDICEAEVKSKNGRVHVHVPAQRIRRTGRISPRLQKHECESIQMDLTNEIKETVKEIPGVNEVFCDVECPYYR